MELILLYKEINNDNKGNGMKDFRFILVVLMSTFLFISLHAAEDFENPLRVSTVSNEKTEIVFSIPQYSLNHHEINGMTFSKVELESALMSGKVGYPELPVFSTTIAVPVNSTIRIDKVIAEKKHYIENVNIYPVQNLQNLQRTFDYSPSFYESKNSLTVYPESNYSVSDIQVIRDMNVVNISVQPMRFYPDSKRVEVIEEIKITIEHKSRNASPVYYENQRISRAFEPIYRGLIANYDQVRVVNPTYQEPSLLIIYGGTPNETILTQLKVWKMQRGFDVVMVGTSVTGTTTGSIKNYIQNAYNTWENPPEFVMLIGDTSGSFTIPCFTHTGGSTDYPYTHLAGNDTLGDVIIGRLSVATHNDIDTVINKILTYEKTPFLAGSEWYNKNLLIGDSQSSGVSTYIVNRYIKSLLLDYDSNHNFYEYYMVGPSASNMVTHMNAGLLHFNYRGYIGMSGFGASQVGQLNNVNMLTNCVWLTCSTGSFDGTAIVETVLRHSTAGGGLAGAITATGMATSGTTTAMNNALNGGLFYGLYPAGLPTMGQAVMFSRLYLNQVYGQSAATAKAESSVHWINLMGDPSLNLFKTVPKTFSTDLPSSIPQGTQSLRLVILDSSNQPVEDAWVTISRMNGTYISKAITNSNGVAFLEVDPEQGGTLALVVSKEGFAPKIAPVITNQGATVAVENYLVNDFSGNNNGQINPGETIALTVNIKNYTSTDLSNLTATISSESDLVSFTNQTLNIGSIGAGATQNFTDAFTFDVSPLTPDKSLLPLTITITNGVDTWVSYLLPEIKGIDMDVMSMNTEFNNNYVDIDTPTNIYFNLKNNGSYTAYNLNATLISRSMFLAVLDSTAFIGNVIPGQTVSNSNDMFFVNIASSVIPGMFLRAELRITDNAGYEEIIPIRILAGNKETTDPVGPCEYGYVIYDITDVEYEDAPVYDWLEISTIGQNTGINDVTGGQEEDQAIVSLPFTARYYGLEYDQITICSNGFFTFAHTEQKDFRNLPLPGPIAPKTMVAPYWTDLVVGASQGGGGVYTYYDQENHAFIVQWDKARIVSDYPGSTGVTLVPGVEVTFQAIIYNPEFHATPFGDSPLKFQYKDFHPGVAGTDRHPMNYITVGFHDHTELRGLSYVYNNRYVDSPGAATITNEFALYITQPSILNEEPYMIIDQVFFHDQNGNDIIEAGEYLNIGVRLTNAGLQPAENLSANIVFNSPFISIVNGSSDYPVIESMTSGSNLNYFTVLVSSNTPNNHSISGTLEIINNDKVWFRNFEFTVRKPSLTYRSYLINDINGNGNGILEEGENAKLIINLTNTTLLDINNVIAMISSTSPHLTINHGSVVVNSISRLSGYQCVFDITVSDNVGDITSIPFTLNVTSSNAPTLNLNLNLGLNQSGVLLQESFESWLPSGWIIQYYFPSWSLSDTNNAGGTAPEVKFTGSNAADGLSRMITPTMDASEISNALLTFRHKANVVSPGVTIGVATRANYSDWQVVWSQELTENIPARIENVAINNAHLGSTNLQLSWFIQGNYNAISEWFIDDVFLQTAFGNTAILSGRINIEDYDSDIRNIRVKAGDYITSANTDSTYTLYILPGTFNRFEALHPYTEGSFYSNIQVEAGELLSDYDFDLLYRVPPKDLYANVNEDGVVTLHWQHQYNYNQNPLNFSHFNVYRQINSTVFEKIAETNQMTFTETLDKDYRYRYYIRARYENGISDSTTHIFIDPNIVPDSDLVEMPLVFEVKQNYPNPFNPVTNIAFTIPEAGNVNIKIFNVKGQLVKNLKNEFMDKGQHIVQWNGTNDYNKSVSSGIYFIRVENNKQSAIRKALLLK